MVDASRVGLDIAAGGKHVAANTHRRSSMDAKVVLRGGAAACFSQMRAESVGCECWHCVCLLLTRSRCPSDLEHGSCMSPSHRTSATSTCTVVKSGTRKPNHDWTVRITVVSSSQAHCALMNVKTKLAPNVIPHNNHLRYDIHKL